MATTSSILVLSTSFKKVVESVDSINVLQKKSINGLSAYEKKIIQAVNKFGAELNVNKIIYLDLPSDTYIGVVVNNTFDRLCYVCIVPPIVGTRSGFISQQLFGFVSDLVQENLDNESCLLTDKKIVVINTEVADTTKSEHFSISCLVPMGIEYCDLYGRKPEVDYPKDINEFLTQLSTYRETIDVEEIDKRIVFKTNRLKGLTQTLTNQPYYFAINAYPAAILGWRKGMVLDISQFEDWFNNKHDNKNVFAFCLFIKKLQKLPVETKSNSHNEPLVLLKYLTAIRCKPFLLLAGISGTGKSRIVRELAFKSCPKYLQDKDETIPGNYCMIEVKPNWHDSTELLGYYSNLNKAYQFKKFVQFMVKAKMNPNVPFFVCLDEMNLAPVEQYFAEILSVLETRKHPKNEKGEVDMSTIKAGVIVEGKHFSQIYQKDMAGVFSTVEKRISDGDWYASFFKEDQMSDAERAIVEKNRSEFSLCDQGLTLPDNVIIIGTVNMDDTTHQFSRKVIDRAMTIEMNGGRLKNMFGGSNDLVYLKEEEQQKWQTAFKQKYVNADEVLKAHADKADEIVNLLPEKLEAINAALKGTPFEVSYRVLNELTIMVGVMLDNAPEEELETIVNNALDRILLMKILPRIEGDSDMFNLKDPLQVGDATCRNRLEWLSELAPAIAIHDDEGKNHQQTAKEKIKEMIERLENQEFTRFWP